MHEAKECVHVYNTELLDPVKDTFRYVVICGTILQAVLCILCYKWRFLIHSFIYVECTIRVCASFVPNVYNEAHSNIDLAMLSSIFFLGFYTEGIGQVIFNTLSCAFAVFFDVHVVYQNKLTFDAFIMNVIIIVFVFLCQIVSILFFTYVQTLHSKLEF